MFLLMSWISQADLLACPAGSVNTALSNLITSTLTAKLSKGKSPQSCRQGGWDRGRSCLNTLPLHSMTNGIWKPLPGPSILLSPCPWDGARRRCSQAEQTHGTLGRAKMGRSELPVLIPGQTVLGHLLGLVSILNTSTKSHPYPTKGPVQSPGTGEK